MAFGVVFRVEMFELSQICTEIQRYTYFVENCWKSIFLFESGGKVRWVFFWVVIVLRIFRLSQILVYKTIL